MHKAHEPGLQLSPDVKVRDCCGTGGAHHDACAFGEDVALDGGVLAQLATQQDGRWV